jgi:hypothetical protein
LLHGGEPIREIWCEKRLTLRAAASAVRLAAAAFSWVFLFFKRVSGTRTCSRVAVVLLKMPKKKVVLGSMRCRRSASFVSDSKSNVSKRRQTGRGMKTLRDGTERRGGLTSDELFSLEMGID